MKSIRKNGGVTTIEYTVIALLIVTLIVSSASVFQMAPLTSSITTLSEKMDELSEKIEELEPTIEPTPEPIEKETIITMGLTTPVGGPSTPLFNPGAYEMTSVQIFEGLVDMEPGTTKLIPILATNTGETDDSITWTFYLRRGIKFHDGTDFNAYAVKKHFDIALEMCSGLTYFWAEYMLNRTEVVDDYTVRFVLNYPSNVFPKVISMFSAFIESPTSIEKYGIEGIDDHPIGTGPFKYVSQKMGEETVLEPNQDWWRLKSEIAGDAYVGQDKINVDKLIFKQIPDSSVLRMAIEAGVIDVALGEINPVDLPDLLANQELVSHDIGGTASIYYLVFEGDPTLFPTFHKKEMRQALSYAIDYDAIINIAYGGLADRLYSFILPEFPEWKSAAKYYYDPEKAKSLIEEAEYETPVEIKLWMSSERYGSITRDVAVIIQASAAEAGFDITIEDIDYPTFRAYRVDDVMEIHYRFWNMDYPDSENYVGGFVNPYGSLSRQAKIHETDFEEMTERVDELSQLQLSTPDPETKKEAIYELQDIWAEYLPEILLYRPKAYTFTLKNIEGVTFSAVSKYDVSFYSAYKTD